MSTIGLKNFYLSKNLIQFCKLIIKDWVVFKLSNDRSRFIKRYKLRDRKNF